MGIIILRYVCWGTHQPPQAPSQTPAGLVSRQTREPPQPNSLPVRGSPPSAGDRTGQAALMQSEGGDEVWYDPDASTLWGSFRTGGEAFINFMTRLRQGEARRGSPSRPRSDTSSPRPRHNSDTSSARPRHNASPSRRRYNSDTAQDGASALRSEPHMVSCPDPVALDDVALDDSVGQSTGTVLWEQIRMRSGE